mgnify:CR=1 FL=1
MIIRPEHPNDAQTIGMLTAEAFAPMGFSDGTEGTLVENMRDAGDLTLSLVAELDGKIIGHVAFSPASVSETDGEWFALGPISVALAHQRKGIGRALTFAGLAELCRLGAAGCILTGNPAVYQKMCFTSDGGLHHQGTADRHVHWRILNGPPPR